MTVAHPAFGKGRVFAQQDLVSLDRFSIFADPHQSRGAQRAVARIVRILFHEQVDLLECLRRFHLPVQHRGVILPRRQKARREFQRTCKQVFGIFIAPEPRTGFREHADRRDVGRMLFHKRAQQPLCDRQAVLAKCGRGFDKLRIVDRRLDVARIGGIGGGPIFQHRVQVAEHAPGRRIARVQRRRARERCRPPL